MKIFFCALAIIFLSVLSCQRQQSGERLAKQHCGSCHMFPEPSLLDKKTWEKQVFPEMAFRMGLDNSPLNNIPFEDQDPILRSLPDEPMVSIENWERIKKFYNDNAPDSLAIPDRVITDTIKQFKATALRLPIEQHHSITHIAKDPNKDKIYIGNRPGKLYEFNQKFEIIDSFKVESAPSKIFMLENGDPMLLLMGVMDPNEQPLGSIKVLQQESRKLITVVDSLKRPVDFERVDLNNDKADDYITCNFGNHTGALVIHQSLGNGKFRKHFLSSMPGARKIIVRDFDGNGLPDVLALMTQGDERILLYYNLGNFQFRLTTLFRFNAAQGSSYIEVVDFNNDGKPDILYTNGDNADFSIILKPFHGVRIFLNSGTNEFKESWFYPMHGASQARVLDFDKDGDLDIAAISFFPDFKKHNDHSFIYFENTPQGYVAQITPLANKGRWITMEACDYDSDGDTDILLGSLAFPTNVPPDIFSRWRKDEISILVLENKLQTSAF